MQQVTPLVTLAFITGLIGGVSIDAPVTLALTLGLSASWVVGTLGWRRGHARLPVGAASLAAVCGGWLLGMQAVATAIHSPLRVLLDQRFGGFSIDAHERRLDDPLIIEGRLLADAAHVDDAVLLRVAVTRIWLHKVAEPTRGTISISVGGNVDADTTQWRSGRTLRAPVLLRRPARYFNHGLPDQERVLARRGVSLVGTIKSAALVEITEHGRWWEESAAAVRARTRAALTRHVSARAPQAAAIATAILIGDRAGLSRDTEQQLQEAGTYHVIAISGGNIAILAAVALALMGSVGLRGRLAALVVIITLAAYGVIAAGGPSVLRATVMAIVYFAVRLIDQRTRPAHAIALAAAAILIARPLQVIDVGFWFTFLATAALVLAAAATIDGYGASSRTPLGTRRRGQAFAHHTADMFHRAMRALAFVAVGTACVELLLAPIAAYVFQRVTVAGLVLNFAALPAMTVVQLGAMAVVAADLVHADALAAWCAAAVHVGASVLLDSARLVDAAPWLTWRVPSPAAAILSFYYLALVTAWIAWRHTLPLTRVLRLVATPCAAAAFVWIVAAPQSRVRAAGDGRLHLSMLDVGQGDSLIVAFPNGRRLLVDAGGLPRGSFDIGDRVVGPVLRGQRRLNLDYVAITHGDIDHVGGARALVSDFRPLEVWWGIRVAGHDATTRVSDEARKRRTTWRTLQRGDRVEIGGVAVHVLHPPPEDWERQRVRNNDSLVLELRYGRVSFLLTGDIGFEVEHALLPGLQLQPLTVLKVAHHGSLSSSSQRFLAAVRPTVALIGVGRGNSYGHPAPHVLGRLQDVGAEIFRTDLDGQITVSTDGESITTTTFTGRHHRVAGPR